MRLRPLLLLLASCSTASSAPSPVPAALPSTPAPTTPAPVPASQPVRAEIGSTTSTAAITQVTVVTAVDDAPATDRPAYARQDQRVTLYAVITTADGTRFSDAPALELGGKHLAPRPMADAPRARLQWFRVEPTSANISNGDGPSFHFHVIDYEATPIPHGAGHPSIVADVRPTLTPDHGHGVGTMRYQAVVIQGDRVVASPGAEARRGRGSGGLTEAVARVSIRLDDTYLGYLTEMYGQPYVWASAGHSDRTHQSERLEGSDCADFIVYGARRMGAKIPYTWTGGLPKVTKLLAAGARADDGVYRTARGQPLPFTQVGDLVLFTRHVGVLTQDRGTPGVLDDQDVIMHTLFDSPKEQAIADSGYAGTPVELRRFRAR